MPVDDDTAARLATYRDLLLRWNATINLVSARTAADMDARHIADSLQLVALLHWRQLELGLLQMWQTPLVPW